MAGFPLGTRLMRAGLIVLASLSLTACYLLPGKFAATLDIRRDGHFTYSYKGEILMLGLTKLVQVALAAANETKPFEAMPCFKDDGVTERECTKQEAADQKTAWETEKAEKAEKAKRLNETLTKAFGGIDPNDPKAAEELAARLRGQAGWNAVTYRGNGIYDVDFMVSGTLDRDLTFPSIERLPAVLPFLAINRRTNGEVRIDLPIMQYSSLGTPMGNAGQVFAQTIGMNKGEN